MHQTSSKEILLPLVAMVLSYVLTALAIRWFKAGFQDQANERSLHEGVTPKFGGLPMFPSVVAVMLISWISDVNGQSKPLASVSVPQLLLLWAGCAAVIYSICVLNDRTGKELSAMVRLAGFFLACLCFVVGLNSIEPSAFSGLASSLLTNLVQGSSVMGAFGTMLLALFVLISVLAFTNFFNFMDGMDGLAGSMATIGFGAMACTAWLSPANAGEPLSLVAASIALCNLAFLRWNWPKARLFMGDTGSTFLGFSAAALGWIGAVEGVWHWASPFLIFFPFWFDAVVTLVRRALRGEKIWKAHREHSYQRAVLGLRGLNMSQRHLVVLIAYIVLMLLSSAAALKMHFAWLLHMPYEWHFAAILAAMHAAGLHWADRLYQQKRREQQTQDERSVR